MDVVALAPAFEAPSPTILVVEDDLILGRLLQNTLETEGYSVVVVPSGEEALRFALREVPQLLLLDIMLPGIDGFEVVEQLRNTAKTAHIPVVMLSARHDTADKVRAFAYDVDDYLTKPFHTEELIARIRTQLRHVRESLLSPLTGLPSGLRIERAIEHQLRSSAPWSILYLDINTFKAYNDVYGFLRGNELIRLLARVVTDCVREEGNISDFVGHIGGDDFLIITTPDKVDRLCRALIDSWETESRALFTPEDRKRGTLIARDRQGQIQTHPLSGISIGVVTNVHRSIISMEEVSRIAAQVKSKAKSSSGSGYYVDRRASDN
ncbi:MAG: response regulator [Ktedonobacterales bacterium]